MKLILHGPFGFSLHCSHTQPFMKDRLQQIFKTRALLDQTVGLLPSNSGKLTSRAKAEATCMHWNMKITFNHEGQWPSSMDMFLKLIKQVVTAIIPFNSAFHKSVSVQLEAKSRCLMYTVLQVYA